MPSTALVMPAEPPPRNLCLIIAERRSTVTPRANKRPLAGPSEFRISVRLQRRLRRILAGRDFARLLDLVPHLLLGEVHQARQDGQEDDDLETGALALHELGLGGR